MAEKKASYPHLAARVFDTPLLIEQSKLNTILNYLGPRLEVDVAPYEGQMFEYSDPDRHMGTLQRADIELTDEGYYVVNGRTAVIPVMGTLIQRGDWMTAMSGMTSYNQISKMFLSAMDDNYIQSIIMEYDTPGGEVAGAFDTADMMFEMRGKKPVIAVASEFAASAGYLLASTADELVVPRTGSVGSIGVVGAHYDYSKVLEKKGIAITFVYAGEKKVDGNPYQPLPDSVKEEWQAEINSLYDLFVNTVSRNMDIGVDRIRGTQAGMFMGSNAVAVGLADRINTFSNELSNAVLRMDGSPFRSMRSIKKEQDEMTEKTVTPAIATPEAVPVVVPVAQVTAATPEANTGVERDRIKAIVNHVEANGRTKLANHLAFETSMTVEEAGKLLAASEKESKQSKLDSAMNGNQPKISSQEDLGNPTPQGTRASSVYARRSKEAAAYRQ